MNVLEPALISLQGVIVKSSIQKFCELVFQPLVA